MRRRRRGQLDTELRKAKGPLEAELDRLRAHADALEAKAAEVEARVDRIARELRRA